jgi:hypothetical protein
MRGKRIFTGGGGIVVVVGKIKDRIPFPSIFRSCAEEEMFGC